MKQWKDTPIIAKNEMQASCYLESLLEAAWRQNRIGDEVISDFQRQSIQLLAGHIRSYTSGESSSIKIEKAQELREGIFFTISAYLKTLPSTAAALEAVKSQPLEALYQAGWKIIREQTAAGRVLLEQLQAELVPIDNYFYNQTMKEGLKEFFLHYDPAFAPQNNPGSIEYPLIMPEQNQMGIAFILPYIRLAYQENHIISQYSRDEVEGLMRACSQDYQNLYHNIFQLIFYNQMGNCLIGNTGKKIDLSGEEREEIKRQTRRLSKDQLYARLLQTLDIVAASWSIDDEAFILHCQQLARELLTDIGIGLAENCLDQVLPTIQWNEDLKKRTFADNKAMADEIFRERTNEIRECRYFSDKQILIRRYFHSLSDIVDMLSAGCLFQAEFKNFFATLGEMELALLLHRKGTGEDIRSVQQWELELEAYLDQLMEDKRKAITNIYKGF